MLGKLLDTEERNRRWHKNEKKIYYAYGLEELVMLKWPYYLRQSNDSMQSLIKYQQHFSQKNNNSSNPKMFIDTYGKE